MGCWPWLFPEPGPKRSGYDHSCALKPMHDTKRFSMLRVFATVLCVLGVAFGGTHKARGFALIGPSAAYPGLPGGFGDAWEVSDIAYNPYIGYDPLPIGPKNIGEEYRRNTPIVFYT